MLKGSYFTLLKHIFPYLHTHISFYVSFSLFILGILFDTVGYTFVYCGVYFFIPLPKVLDF